MILNSEKKKKEQYYYSVIDVVVVVVVVVVVIIGLGLGLDALRFSPPQGSELPST